MNNQSFDQLCAEEFPQHKELCYLNHAAVGPWPKRALRAVTEFAEENVTLGASNYLGWLEVENALREKLRQLIGADSRSDIALVKNTSEALSIVAFGLNWNASDEVVISNQEFPSNRIIWESLQEKFGVNVIEADFNGQLDPEEAILMSLSDKTKIVSVSSVQYGTGIRINTALLGKELKSRGILFCVDSIQTVGAVHTDVKASQVDFLMADGHKWMLGPEGLGVLYVNPSIRNDMNLYQYGWHMVAERGNYDLKEWRPVDTAVRFECGSPNMLGAHALNAALSVLIKVGMDVVEEKITENSQFLHRRLEGLDSVEIISPTIKGRYAGIVTFKPEHSNLEVLHQQLMKRQVICAKRGGGIRFSPHFYTSKDVLQRAVDILSELI